MPISREEVVAKLQTGAPYVVSFEGMEDGYSVVIRFGFEKPYREGPFATPDLAIKTGNTLLKEAGINSEA